MDHPTRRTALRLTASLAGLSALGRSGMAAPSYPARAVRVIVPFPPGGGTDIFARLVARRLADRLGQPFYVENIPGAGGNVGTGQAARAAADGHTVLFAFGSFAVNPNLYAKVPYDPVRDFAPVTLAVTTPTIVIVHPSMPAATLQDLVGLVRQAPGRHSYASGGFGTQAHLAGEQFRLAFGIDLAHVPFQGAGPAVASVVAGHTPIGLTSLAAGLQQIRDGQLRALATTGARRAGELPNVPTMAELGQPGIIGNSWVGVLAPAGTAPEIVALLHREIAAAMAQAELRARLTALGYEPTVSTPDEFARLLERETRIWAGVIEAAKIKIQ
jgi:tripartite-type tricarboxylate transporter receptor subunit TctC